jgi:hypothetical protein
VWWLGLDLDLDLGLGSVGFALLAGVLAGLVGVGIGGVWGLDVFGFSCLGIEVAARLDGKGDGIDVVLQDERDSVHGMGIIPGEEKQE